MGGGKGYSACSGVIQFQASHHVRPWACGKSCAHHFGRFLIHIFCLWRVWLVTGLHLVPAACIHHAPRLIAFLTIICACVLQQQASFICCCCRALHTLLRPGLLFPLSALLVTSFWRCVLPLLACCILAPLMTFYFIPSTCTLPFLCDTCVTWQRHVQALSFIVLHYILPWLSLTHAAFYLRPLLTLVYYMAPLKNKIEKKEEGDRKQEKEEEGGEGEKGRLGKEGG